MPDRNKLAVYAEEGVKIARTCGTCVHSSFSSPRALWGECDHHSYTHAKHDPKPRPLPAHIAFTCPKWEENPKLSEVRELGQYASLLEKA